MVNENKINKGIRKKVKRVKTKKFSKRTTPQLICKVPHNLNIG